MIASLASFTHLAPHFYPCYFLAYLAWCPPCPTKGRLIACPRPLFRAIDIRLLAKSRPVCLLPLFRIIRGSFCPLQPFVSLDKFHPTSKYSRIPSKYGLIPLYFKIWPNTVQHQNMPEYHQNTAEYHPTSKYA